jgi:hypothetical protein
MAVVAEDTFMTGRMPPTTDNPIGGGVEVGSLAGGMITFIADLASLARQGAVLFERLFRDNRVFDTLPELIRHEAAASGRPAVLNVADPTISDPDRQHPVPWSLIYDLPMPQDPGGEYRVCPSVRRFGPEGTGEPVPPHCPETDHAGSILCPFGFWGLSTVVEQPASTDSLVWHVFSGAVPARVELATDPQLDSQLTDRHLAALDSSSPTEPSSAPPTTPPSQTSPPSSARSAAAPSPPSTTRQAPPSPGTPSAWPSACSSSSSPTGN